MNHTLSGPLRAGSYTWATNAVSVIDTGDANNPLGDSVQGTVTGSARDLGFLKKPIDIVISS